MIFDIARAWKDEEYRQSLTDEQQEFLKAHPAGEINEEELAGVCGGDWPSDVGSSAASASNWDSSSFFSRHVHSFSLLCDINLFSLDAHVISLDHLIGIAKCEERICIHEA